MTEIILLTISCFLLGLTTTLHPCPLTTNVAAITMLSGWSAYKKQYGIIAILFIFGYLTSYLLLSIALSSGLISLSWISIGLQRTIPIFLGPFIILVGMVMADLLNINRYYKGKIGNWIRKQKWSLYQVYIIGLLISLSFCPATAGIFFGILIPLSVKHDQAYLFPIIYAVGASIPLITISVLIHRGTLSLLKKEWYKKVPIIAGWALIIIGIYITIDNLYLN